MFKNRKYYENSEVKAIIAESAADFIDIMTDDGELVAEGLEEFKEVVEVLNRYDTSVIGFNTEILDEYLRINLVVPFEDIPE